MYNRIKKSMPTGILTVGILISAVLMIISYFIENGSFSYKSFIIREYLRESSIVIIAECIIASALFRHFLTKEQSSDRDFGQK